MLVDGDGSHCTRYATLATLHRTTQCICSSAVIDLHCLTDPFEMSKAFSAPSKALIAGGYLVLDPAFTSYVTALSCRMHARIEVTETSSQSSIQVASPQFNGYWNYNVTRREGGFSIERSTPGKNPFLDAVVKTVLSYRIPETPFSYKITLFSDPGYHSQEGAERRFSKHSKKCFLYHGKPIDMVPKTGMGLSAGLVSVVTAALITTILGQPLSETRDIIHKVAQIAHCDAQGKIGSGFDVAAAIYGSIIYRRFPPLSIEHLLRREVSPELSMDLQKVVDLDWDFVSEPCSLPHGIRLLMGDIKGGSETPKLVAKVLAWRKADPESEDVYRALDLANLSFARDLGLLHSRYEQNRSKYLEDLGSGQLLTPLKLSISAIRTGLQTLTQKTGAEIEPPEQTQLLDACTQLPGCLGGVVPGAGGYDAICLLVEASKIEDFKLASAEFTNVTWLDLSEESQGIVEVDSANYENL